MVDELKEAKEKTEKTYKCDWPGCGNTFKMLVGRKTSSKGKKGNVSSQVKCPRCGNYLKTW